VDFNVLTAGENLINGSVFIHGEKQGRPDRVIILRDRDRREKLSARPEFLDLEPDARLRDDEFDLNIIAALAVYPEKDDGS
jgi:hypothetical protein